MIHYCPYCGCPVNIRIPEGDARERAVCDACHAIHYENPKLIVAAIAEWQGGILLCQRAIEPGYGRWTLPGGFMENGESLIAAAMRETQEEACAFVNLEHLFAVIDMPSLSQVHLFYRGMLQDGRHAPGEESLDARLFQEKEIPWENIGPRVQFCLKRYLEDRKKGSFGFHLTTF